jgi:hypothetical protein
MPGEKDYYPSKAFTLIVRSSPSETILDFALRLPSFISLCGLGGVLKRAKQRFVAAARDFFVTVLIF